MNNKIAAGILLLLLCVYVLTEWLSKPADRTFNPEIMSVNSEQVTSVHILPPGSDQPLILTGNSTGWQVSKVDLVFPADSQRVTSLLQSMAKVISTRFVAKSPEKWSNYEVGPEGTRVTVWNGQSVLADFRVGRFAFNQQRRTGISYIRLEGQDEVMAIEGFFSLGFPPELDSYRDRQIWDIEESAINQVQWVPSSTMLTKNSEGRWLLNSVDVDSSATYSFLKTVSNLSVNGFYYGSEPLTWDTVLQITSDQRELNLLSALGDDGILVLKTEAPWGTALISDADSSLIKSLNPNTAYE